MNLKQRRLIMFSFIITFFVLAPIILFYASGYRLDFKRYKVIKTGTLFIETKDIKKADLYLNNEKQAGTFTDKKFIYNLLPGEYQIKLSKAGYHDWQKKAVIYSGLTTFLKNAVLFKKEVPLQIVEEKIADFKVSPDETKIVYTAITDASEEIYFYGLNDKQKLLAYSPKQGEKSPSLSWAASSKKILAGFDGEFIIIDAQDPKDIYNLKNILDFTPDQIRWDAQSDNLLYTQYENAIYKIDLFNKSAEKIFSSEIDLNPEFLIDGNDLFYIEQAESQNNLKKYNSSFKTDKQIISIRKSDNYKFIKTTSKYLGLIDAEAQKLYLIKKIQNNLDIYNATEQVKEFTAGSATWDYRDQQLLYHDDFEISYYNIAENKEQFINRFGQLIKKIDWYPDTKHFVMLIDNQLLIVDITQEAGTRNNIEIIKFDQISDFYLDRKGENIIFNGRIGNQQGLYKLPLK